MIDNPQTPDRRERYAVAIHDAMEPDLSLVDQEPGCQALFARAAEAAVALADAELADLREKLAASERIRENADFHLGQEMARRQAAEKETARLSADRAAVLRAAAQHLYTALFPAIYGDMGQKAAEGVNRAVSELRRMADEAQQGPDEEALRAKVDEATATLRRIRSTIRILKDQGATGRAYYEAITDDLAGPRPDRYERADEAQQGPECSASISGSCLAEGQSETACDTEAGECVHGGQSARSDVGTEFVRQADQPDEAGLAAFETDLAEAQQQPDTETPTESVDYQVVGDWGVDGAETAAGARAAVAKWLRAYPKCGAYAQQRIVRDWPDGSEYYGPWTDLPPTASGPGRVADEGQAETGEADRIVAYRDPHNPRVLLCREHGRRYIGMVPVTSDELPDGGVCTFGRLSSLHCGRDVLIPQEPQ